MTEDEFRVLALALPEAVESEHMGHPDFRVRNKIFAGLSEDRRRATLKLPRDEARMLTEAKPSIYTAPGGWGRYGWTSIDLGKASPDELRELVAEAWCEVAPKRLVAAFEESQDSPPQ